MIKYFCFLNAHVAELELRLPLYWTANSYRFREICLTFNWIQPYWKKTNKKNDDFIIETSINLPIFPYNLIYLINLLQDFQDIFSWCDIVNTSTSWQNLCDEIWTRLSWSEGESSINMVRYSLFWIISPQAKRECH